MIGTLKTFCGQNHLHVLSKGAVYIYNGKASLDVNLQSSQMIRSSSFESKPVYFGYSVSSGSDIDQNEYPGEFKYHTKPVVSYAALTEVESYHSVRCGAWNSKVTLDEDFGEAFGNSRNMRMRINDLRTKSDSRPDSDRPLRIA